MVAYSRWSGSIILGSIKLHSNSYWLGVKWLTCVRLGHRCRLGQYSCLTDYEILRGGVVRLLTGNEFLLPPRQAAK